jgi:hypothetical protein
MWIVLARKTMYKFAYKNLVLILCLMLFTLIYFIDDFVVDTFSATIMLSGAMFFCFYKAIKFIKHLICVFHITFSLDRKWYMDVFFDFNFLGSLAVVIITINLIIDSRDAIVKNKQILVENIVSCIGKLECSITIDKKLKLESGKANNFFITSGIITTAFRMEDWRGNGCIGIYGTHSIYSVDLVDTAKCPIFCPQFNKLGCNQPGSS